MAKFGNPLGGTLWISQGYHGDQYGNRALDFGSTRAEAPVYAIADGRVVNRSASGGSWIAIDTANSNIRVWYVHTYKWAKTAGQTVKKGDLIARIAPPTHNGGWPVHLHLGLSWNNGTSGFPNLLDYLDRRITLNTNYVSIANAWFVGTRFDWSKHRDLSYSTTGKSISVGRKVEFTAVTNLRTSPNTGTSRITGKVAKGAVATVIDGPRTAESMQWFDVKFSNGQGWVANVGGNRLKLTDKAITRITGVEEKSPEPTKPETPPPDTCEAEKKEIEALQVQIKALNKEITNYKNIEDSLLKENESFRTQAERYASYLAENEKEIEELKKDRDWLAEHVAERDEEIAAKAMEIQMLQEKIKQLEEEKTCNLETLTLKDFIRWVGMQFGIGKSGD